MLTAAVSLPARPAPASPLSVWRSLAMVALAGFFGQHAATGKGPLAALGEHLASPWTANFATNGTSVPFF